MKLTDFKALTFDCYGTLIHWETGMIEALKPLTASNIYHAHLEECFQILKNMVLCFVFPNALS